MVGYVKFFNSKAGYGFVVDAEDRLKEYFCHVTGTLDKIQKDDKVEFDLVQGHRSPKCVNVRRIDDGNR